MNKNAIDTLLEKNPKLVPLRSKFEAMIPGVIAYIEVGALEK